MVDLRPFKAIMYDWDEVDGDPNAVTAPPYDVLTDAEIARLKKRSLHNVTRLTLPEPAPGKADETKYQAAANLLKRWKKEGILARRKEPALFAYDETHIVDGEPRTVHGFFALLRLDPDYEHVRPHERTHKGPIKDRLELLRATSTDLEPIQFLYTDPDNEVLPKIRAPIDDGNHGPLVEFTDSAGIQHKLWAVTDPRTLEAVHEFFEDRDVYIADGHHRYATALEYARQRRDEENGNAAEDPSYEYKLALFCNRDDPALAVYATFRLIQGLADPAKARARLQEAFDTETLQVSGDAGARATEIQRLVDASGAGGSGKGHRFVFYWGDGEADVVDVPRSKVDEAAMGDHSEAWKQLDVSVLHHTVLPDTLGVDDSNAGEHLRYTRIPEEAVAWVDDGQHQCSVFLAATPLSAVTAIADARDHMPQKSTYFQPKCASGLLFSPLQ